MKMKNGLIILSVWMLAVTAKAQVFSQPERKETRTGNTQFDKGQYAEAEGSYKKALDKKNNMPEATFNLGDAVYQQKKWDDAIKQFQLSAQTNPDPLVKAKAYHNLGNTYLEQKKWDEAIAAYKNALRNNPNDKDTKYNLAYANAMKPKQQNDGSGQDNKDDKKEQDKDKQDQKKPDDKQDKKDEQNKDQQAKDGDKKDQKDKPQQGQQPKISKEDAEKLMQALMNEEQKTAQKMQEKQAKPVTVKIAKDW
jgi:Ca-activated chloride channel family protein